MLKRIVTAALLLVVAAALVAMAVQGRTVASATGPATTTVPAAHVITAYYFHGDKRCANCNNMERFTQAAVTGGFAAECAKGSVRFRSLNTDEPAHAHFIDDFQLTMKLVVLAEERDGRVVRFTKLDKVWDEVKDEAGFKAYIVDGITGFRASQGP